MRRVLWAFCAAALLGGCATTRNFEQPTDEFLRSELKAGDQVAVVTTSGKLYRLEVTSVADDALFGRGKSKSYKISFAVIESIEVHREHPAAATSGVLGATITIALVAAVIAGLENLSDQNWDICGGN